MDMPHIINAMRVFLHHIHLKLCHVLRKCIVPGICWMLAAFMSFFFQSPYNDMPNRTQVLAPKNWNILQRRMPYKIPVVENKRELSRNTKLMIHSTICCCCSQDTWTQCRISSQAEYHFHIFTIYSIPIFFSKQIWKNERAAVKNCDSTKGLRSTNLRNCRHNQIEHPIILQWFLCMKLSQYLFIAIFYLFIAQKYNSILSMKDASTNITRSVTDKVAEAKVHNKHIILMHKFTCTNISVRWNCSLKCEVNIISYCFDKMCPISSKSSNLFSMYFEWELVQTFQQILQRQKEKKRELLL